MARLARVRARLAWGLAAALLAIAPASAQALTLNATKAETGWIRLAVPDAGDATRVTFTEQAGAATEPVAAVQPSGGAAVLRHGAPWLCDRLERSFTATASYPDGSSQTASAAVRTPSCDRRFKLSAHRSGKLIRARVTDRWKTGAAAPRLCVQAPGRSARCKRLALAPGRRALRTVVRARTGGLWRLAIGASESAVYVRPPGTLRLLATGDSMIQYVDSDLKQRLGPRGVGVRSDARISTGLSKPFLLNWPVHAAQQARRLRPDVTVAFIGANDGFPFGGVDCCGEAWVAAYAGRAEAMMRSWSRQGRGLVYGLTLPAPEPAQWRAVYPAVNRAIKRAAARFGGAVKVLDIARTFTPGYRFRKSMTWQGRRETVRQDDGVHLSAAGASIAETLVERALRRDGVL